jgi:GMP synthase (glutamine-hydrolysing)
MTSHQLVAILDFGSQYTQLIARRVREQNVYCRILPWTCSGSELAELDPAGIIFSGGPASVGSNNAPTLKKEILDLPCPKLGICYGLQITAHTLGEKLSTGKSREYGRAKLEIKDGDCSLLAELPKQSMVWMSHGDSVESSENIESLASTEDCPVAVARVKEKNFWGLQFHPEVSHTEHGTKILQNFLFQCCHLKGDWQLGDVVRQSIDSVAEQVGDGSVLIGLSGGVDSSVTAAICQRAIGRRAHAVFVDNGLLRAGEREEVEKAFSGTDLDLRVIDAEDLFLRALAGVTDPEQKRKRIGHTFIDVFREEAQKVKDAHFLAQGTLYPDVIESAPPADGPSVTIKSHHNVGGLPEDLGFELVEPLREFFKDEVRVIGRLLDLPPKLVGRHPFPGPGLAVRIIGEITKARLELLRAADKILIEEIREAGLYDSIFQALAVLLPPMSVGVMGDGRTDEHVIAVRCVDSKDAMTADWTRIPHEVLARISSRITNEVAGVNRVVYDITSKPPATIEWE